MFPEHFLPEERRATAKRCRYHFGPTSVIEASLVLRGKARIHPAQKPVGVFERLILMTTKPGDIVLDPMAGGGTTGEAARNHGRRAILCDASEPYTSGMESRLGVDRIDIQRLALLVDDTGDSQTSSVDRRRLGVEMLALGVPQVEIAEALGVSRETVRQWRIRDQNGDVAPKPRGGRVPALSKLRLEEVLTKAIAEGRTTGKELAAFILEEAGVSYHPDHAKRLARRMLSGGG